MWITEQIRFYSKIIALSVCLLHFTTFSFSQGKCKTSKFDTTAVYTIGQIDTFSVIYGNNVNWLNNNDTLKLTIALHKDTLIKTSNRPFVLFIHGGGIFKGTRYECLNEMIWFAKRGYVTTSVDYRLGWKTNAYPTKCLGDNETHKDALYRAVQDIKAALRFIIANASTLKIDTLVSYKNTK